MEVGFIVILMYVNKYLILYFIMKTFHSWLLDLLRTVYGSSDLPGLIHVASKTEDLDLNK